MLRTTFISFLSLLTLPLVSSAAALTISNETLVVNWSSDPAQLSINARNSERDFLKDGKLSAAGGTGKLSAVSDKTFGAGQAIEITYPNGNRDAVMLFPKLPFALLRSTLHNSGAETSVTPKHQALTATVDLGKPASQLKTLGIFVVLVFALLLLCLRGSRGAVLVR